MSAFRRCYKKNSLVRIMNIKTVTHFSICIIYDIQCSKKKNLPIINLLNEHVRIDYLLCRYMNLLKEKGCY